MRVIRLFRALCLSMLLTAPGYAADKHALVLMTDFGTDDGAVSAMRGVAFAV